MKSITYLLLIICIANGTFAQSSNSLDHLSRKEIRDLIMNQTEDPMAAGLMNLSHRKSQAATATAISGILIFFTAISYGSNMDAANGSPEVAIPVLLGMTGLTLAAVGVGLSASSESKFKEAKGRYLGSMGNQSLPETITSYNDRMSYSELKGFLLRQNISIKAQTVATKSQKYKNIASGLIAVSITSLLVGLASDSGKGYWGGLSGASFFGWAMVDRKSNRLLNDAEEIYLHADMQTSGNDVFIRDESILFAN